MVSKGKSYENGENNDKPAHVSWFTPPIYGDFGDGLLLLHVLTTLKHRRNGDLTINTNIMRFGAFQKWGSRG